MKVKNLIYIVFSFLLWLSFLKVFEGILFPFYLGDPFLALALVLISSLKPYSFWVFLILFFLGIFKGIFLVGEILWGVTFVLLGIFWENFEKYFKLEGFKLKIICWFLSILLITLINELFFMYRLKITNKINLEFLISLGFKSLIYFSLTFIWTLFLYFLFLKLGYEKME